ncbi:RecQ family ATP-dependent DNA helicase [Phytopseudomonas dryadis]|uniref:DNA 3'-5' helicase n=1 Tax=Phytopseudomonas dryadis TaxID=2487520 RepID=A0ABY1Z7J5_9GAMM|nr:MULTISPECIES: RecQ family ATP-dependent DNA helicase [Pseudomonas]TBV05089.1 ATP-dependent DNA helicase RecG [Pseudomonas dryadis]TBV16491.1 ATP-dependent DNA helicase RecG [Pseudomonas sp. FRB 230]
MATREQAEIYLQRALAQPQAHFRDGQWEAIDALVNHRHKLLVVQRTGWGKSSVYFIATRLLRDAGAGQTIIVSPLLALMRNQIDAAQRLGVRASTINSSNADQWPQVIQEVLANQVDVLLVSPERFANDRFSEEVLLPLAQNLGLFVVDEAHCISDWGHDFRPDYRRLVNVLQRMPSNLPILGTTATANDRVVDDIVGQLGNIRVLRGSLMRESLALQTTRLGDQAARLAWLAHHIPQMHGSGIVYVLTQRDAGQVARWLNENGILAEAYFSGAIGPDGEETNVWREQLEDRLQRNQLKALVATTALGMGYDKPDLGFVIHYQSPGSIVGYYQQVGRAGRGINRALGILLAGDEDARIHEFFRRSAFPDERQVSALLEALENSDGLTERDLEQRLNVRHGRIGDVLKYLSVENPAPVIKQDKRWVRTPVPYRLDVENIRRLTGIREQEWQEMQDYMATTSCKMEFLARVLDDPSPGPCGKCASCLGQSIVPETFPQALGVKAAQFLRHSEFPLECKKQIAAGAFPLYGFHFNTIPQALRAETGRVLSRWGDAGWGTVVEAGKQAGHFGDELVEAVAEMIRNRWRPEPAPTWVTCIPSRNHPELVPDFSRRLAQRLGLPFHPAITKRRDNQQQKFQQNRYHQCSNLDGVFGVEGQVPAGPVLLVDDMVDSAWTLTVAAILLRQAGCPAVLPVALAATSDGD